MDATSQPSTVWDAGRCWPHGGYAQHGSVGVKDEGEGLLVFDQAQAQHVFIEGARPVSRLMERKATSLLPAAE